MKNTFQPNCFAAILGLLLIFFITSSDAQNPQDEKEPPHTGITIGWAIPVLDGGAGFHLAVNPHYSFSEFFAIEGQVSYAYSKVKKFIVGDPAKTQAANVLAGGRIYILEEDRSFRPYLNLMGGILYFYEKDFTTKTVDSYYSLGLSAGLHIKMKNGFLIGLVGETPAFVVLKIGYDF